MTDVFYRGLSRLVNIQQVPLKSALADKARSEDVRKMCLRRALTTFFSATSCAGHVMKGDWNGLSMRQEAAQVPYFKEVLESIGYPALCAGHVLELLTSQSTLMRNGGLL